MPCVSRPTLPPRSSGCAPGRLSLVADAGGRRPHRAAPVVVSHDGDATGFRGGGGPSSALALRGHASCSAGCDAGHRLLRSARERGAGGRADWALRGPGRGVCEASGDDGLLLRVDTRRRDRVPHAVDVSEGRLPAPVPDARAARRGAASALLGGEAPVGWAVRRALAAPSSRCQATCHRRGPPAPSRPSPSASPRRSEPQAQQSTHGGKGCWA